VQPLKETGRRRPANAPFDVPWFCASKAPGVWGAAGGLLSCRFEKTTKDDNQMSDVAERVKKIVV